MQAISQKHLDLSLFNPILDKTQSLGLSATVSFITGYPQEEQKDQDGTLDLMGSCFHRSGPPLNVQLHLLTPEPGTKLVEDFSARMAYDGHVSDFNFPTLEEDDASIMEASPSIFMNHHYFESVLPRARHVFVTSLYHYLFNLGSPLLSHLLGHYGGRFSILMSDMYRYAEGLALHPPYRPSFVRNYIIHFFGATIISYRWFVTCWRGRNWQAASRPIAPAQRATPRTSRIFRYALIARAISSRMPSSFATCMTARPCCGVCRLGQRASGRLQGIRPPNATTTSCSSRRKRRAAFGILFSTTSVPPCSSLWPRPARTTNWRILALTAKAASKRSMISSGMSLASVSCNSSLPRRDPRRGRPR